MKIIRNTLKKIKIGQIYKLKRKKADGNKKSYTEKYELYYCDIKETYDSSIEITPSSLYIIKSIIYKDEINSKQITQLEVTDIDSEYTETVDVDRIYGNFDEKKILRKRKMKKFL